jgi:hypothetical protein
MTKAAIAGAATDGATIREIAEEAFAALNTGGRHVLPFSTRYPAFSVNEAYRVAALANNMRVARGYKPLGRKIGFTNRRMWDEYGVRAPNWGYIYDRTMHDLALPLSLAPYTEPKIEPENHVRLCRRAFRQHGRRRTAFVYCVGSAWFRDRAIDLSGLEVFGGRHRGRQCNARSAAGRAAP